MGATHDTIPSPLSDVVRRELFFTFQDGGFTIAFIETLTLIPANSHALGVSLTPAG